MSDALRCALCGIRDYDVAVGIVSWADRRGAHRGWGAVPRCFDHDACRGRLLEAGQPWPLIGSLSGPNSPGQPPPWRPPDRVIEPVRVPVAAASTPDPDDPREWW